MPYGPYDDGSGRPRYADPVRAYRRLLSGLGGDPNALLKRFDDLSDDEAREKVIQAAGWSLEMVPFDPATGLGATEELVESVLDDFLEWLEKNGRTAPGSATWSPPTGPASSPSTATPRPGSSSG